jgi:hypothetical protein
VGPRAQRRVGVADVASRRDPETAELVTLVKRSTLLDATLQRSWLRLVPDLSPRDRARLTAILRESTQKDRGPAKVERDVV